MYNHWPCSEWGIQVSVGLWACLDTVADPGLWIQFWRTTFHSTWWGTENCANTLCRYIVSDMHVVSADLLGSCYLMYQGSSPEARSRCQWQEFFGGSFLDFFGWPRILAMQEPVMTSSTAACLGHWRGHLKIHTGSSSRHQCLWSQAPMFVLIMKS